ncbi:Hypothetical predicted protein [Mytilus galloprovincialis]|uniref:Uncharacterized protein n=1 Tax=Mytilus galloprovincialis TaxID=29158 RepID=A0A8B6FKN0_MYTGA|nr:Hypothetical predicted protein [Mytilus galloprovincialis]
MEVALCQERLVVVERRFRKACEQIVHMNHRLSNLERRYNRAKKEGNKSFRYTLRLRIAVVDGVREVFYQFAYQKAKEADELRGVLKRLTC